MKTINKVLDNSTGMGYYFIIRIDSYRVRVSVPQFLVAH